MGKKVRPKKRSLLTREASRALGQAEYWNPANKGKSVGQVFTEKYSKAGISSIWKREFINGWYGATMSDEPIPVPPAYPF